MHLSLTHGPTAAEAQLHALLDDARFHRLLRGVRAEVMRHWCLPPATASGIVMSAVGDPRTLADLHHGWFVAEPAHAGAALTKLILRRRVFDLLRGDARRARHISLPLDTDEVDATVRSCALSIARDPCRQAELQQVADRVHAALEGFAAQGTIQARQARLVRRYVLDEVPGSALADELGCTRNALSVRVHKAMHALRRYIEAHHPDLGAQRTVPLDRKIVRGSMSPRVTQRGSRRSGDCFASSFATPSLTAAPIDRRLASSP